MGSAKARERELCKLRNRSLDYELTGLQDANYNIYNTVRTLGVAATRANARMRLRVLGTLFGRRADSQYNRASREEARFREAEWDNYLRHGPRGHAEYHHGFEHCI